MAHLELQLLLFLELQMNCEIQRDELLFFLATFFRLCPTMRLNSYEKRVISYEIRLEFFEPRFDFLTLVWNILGKILG